MYRFFYLVFLILFYAGVAEWQTQWTQNPPVAISYGFKSRLRHHKNNVELGFFGSSVLFFCPKFFYHMAEMHNLKVLCCVIRRYDFAETVPAYKTVKYTVKVTLEQSENVLTLAFVLSCSSTTSSSPFTPIL